MTIEERKKQLQAFLSVLEADINERIIRGWTELEELTKKADESVEEP